MMSVGGGHIGGRRKGPKKKENDRKSVSTACEEGCHVNNGVGVRENLLKSRRPTRAYAQIPKKDHVGLEQHFSANKASF